MKNKKFVIRLFSIFPITGEGRCDCFSVITIIAGEINPFYSPEKETKKYGCLVKLNSEIKRTKIWEWTGKLKRKKASGQNMLFMGLV
jgi:hypothetical protein